MRKPTYAPATLIRRFKYRDLWVFCRGAMFFQEKRYAVQCAAELRGSHIAANVVTLPNDDARSVNRRICLFVEDNLRGDRLSKANEIFDVWREWAFKARFKCANCQNTVYEYPGLILEAPLCMECGKPLAAANTL